MEPMNVVLNCEVSNNDVDTRRGQKLEVIELRFTSAPGPDDSATTWPALTLRPAIAERLLVLLQTAVDIQRSGNGLPPGAGSLPN